MSSATRLKSDNELLPKNDAVGIPQPQQPVHKSEKISDEHLRRAAIVYVRQSSQHQVLEHRESTARQYALTERAIALGWPQAAIDIIDEDQGQSGSSIEGRLGFQHLLSEVSSDRVGIILGLEMSRLARSCKDWHALLELCAIYRTLLADADGLYDPSDYNDRLLLGLKGTMSEAELHILKSRMHQGMWNKAKRGEILNHPPIGYVRSAKARDGAGDYVMDPDEQVQQVVRLIFEQFSKRGSIHGLIRYMVGNEIEMPIRPHYGPNRGELEWRRPNRVTLLNLLHHPIYAGAYRWGHREIDQRKKKPGRRTTGRTLKSHEDCRVLIRDRFPAYITWEEFEENQRKLRENSSMGKLLSAPRHGPSTLAGLVVCGRCGRRMLVGYVNADQGEKAKSLRYSCLRAAIDYGEETCQSLSGAKLEEFVGHRILQAASPASLKLSLSAAEDIEHERTQLDKHWQQMLSRARYETDYARRQYSAVDPDHRLVSRELERQWEEAIRKQEELEAEYDRFSAENPTQLSPKERDQIHALALDLPALWNSPTTTPEDRQAIARLLLEQVTVTVEGNTDRCDIELRWAGGFVSRHNLTRPVQTYRQLSNYQELIHRFEMLRGEGKTLAQIADTLNAEGFHPPKRSAKFNKGILANLLRERRAKAGTRTDPKLAKQHLKQHEWWLADLASELSMPIATLHRWRRVGWIEARKVKIGAGRWAIYADSSELQRMRQLRKATLGGWPPVYPSELTTPQRNSTNSNSQQPEKR